MGAARTPVPRRSIDRIFSTLNRGAVALKRKSEDEDLMSPETAKMALAIEALERARHAEAIEALEQARQSGVVEGNREEGSRPAAISPRPREEEVAPLSAEQPQEDFVGLPPPMPPSPSSPAKAPQDEFAALETLLGSPGLFSSRAAPRLRAVHEAQEPPLFISVDADAERHQETMAYAFVLRDRTDELVTRSLRYSCWRGLHDSLPYAVRAAVLVPFPPKHWHLNLCVPEASFGKKSAKLATERAVGLQQWAAALLALPGATELPTVRSFFGIDACPLLWP